MLASFDEDAPEISPGDVDWRAVADGRATVKVRQLPGPANSMGRVKFGFANDFGIFLHDTPRKELFAAEQRAISNGCVRLEDAPRLARWMMGRDPATASPEPEQHVLLPAAVPIYITYLNVPAAPQMALAAGGIPTQPLTPSGVGELLFVHHRAAVLALGRDVAVDEFDDRDRRGVRGADAGLDDAGVAAVARRRSARPRTSNSLTSCASSSRRAVRQPAVRKPAAAWPA